MNSRRIIVITNGNYFARLILAGLFEELGPCIKRVVLITGDYKGRTGFAALRWLMRKTAFPYIVYKVVQMLGFAAAQRLRRRAVLDVDALAKAYGVPVVSFVTIRSDEAVRCVLDDNPDLLVSVSCPQRIGERLLSAPEHGAINIHSSLLPGYRGLAPYYWVLADDERATGTTVHYMTANFDEGNILAQARLDIAPGESAFSLFRRLALAGSPALVEAARRALAGDAGTPQPEESPSYRSHPDFASYRRLRQNGHRLMRLRELWRSLAEKR
jgi:folate-dependent phosphoribosylglycinamide formyltransferase PurN